MINTCREACQIAKPQVNILLEQLLFSFRIQKNLPFFAVGKRQENAVRHRIGLPLSLQPPAVAGSSLP